MNKMTKLIPAVCFVLILTEISFLDTVSDLRATVWSEPDLVRVLKNAIQEIRTA